MEKELLTPDVFQAKLNRIYNELVDLVEDLEKASLRGQIKYTNYGSVHISEEEKDYLAFMDIVDLTCPLKRATNSILEVIR